MSRYATESNEGADRVRKLGGISYRPDFLLDCVIMCDTLASPSTLSDAVDRTMLSVFFSNSQYQDEIIVKIKINHTG